MSFFERLGRAFGHCWVCGKPTRSHVVGSRLQCHECREAGRFPALADGGEDLRERIEEYVRLNPDDSAPAVIGALKDTTSTDRALVEDVLENVDVDGGDRARPRDHDVVDETSERDLAAEAQAIAGEPPREPQRDDDPYAPELDPVDGGEPDSETMLMAAMGEPDAAEKMQAEEPAAAPELAAQATGGPGHRVGGLPLGQLDALDSRERRRLASKRGLDIPTTDDARERLFQTITEVMAEGDDRVIDAPTSLGKSYTIATTPWGADQYSGVTGDQPVVHLSKTRDARDEAIDAARSAGLEQGTDWFALASRHEACDCAAGDHDPHPEGDDDRQVVTADGQPASEWIEAMCEGKGLPFSVVHQWLGEYNDQGVALPCGGDECRAIRQWDEIRDRDYPLVFATHNFAHVPGLRAHTNLVLDEEPDYARELSTERVRQSVTAFLQRAVQRLEINADVETWEGLIRVAQNGLTYNEHDPRDFDERRAAVDAVLDFEPDLEWYREDERAHTLAPALARAIYRSEERTAERRVGKTRFEPPRLDGGARDEDDWNASWVTVVLDEANDVEGIRVTPDVSICRSVIGLDAHPALPLWQLNCAPWIQTVDVLDREERRLWRRYERGLRVVQVGDATRPPGSEGQFFDDDGAEAVVEQLREQYGDAFRTAITASAVEDDVEAIMSQAGIRRPELMHYGEEKSRNDFVDEPVGYVEGCIDPGDDYVLRLCAELDQDVEAGESECGHCEGTGADPDRLPDDIALEDAIVALDPDERAPCPVCDGTGRRREHGRTWQGPDAEVAEAVLASVREAHVAQAAGRWARNPDDPTAMATVYVRTDAMPVGFADVQTPGAVWTYGPKQERIVEVLQETTEPLSAREIAHRADCSKRHVTETLDRLQRTDEDDDRAPAVQAFEGAGKHGATLYAEDGVPNHGAVDLGSDETANPPVLGSSNTWGFAIREPGTTGVDTDGSDGPADAADGGDWQWQTAEAERDPPD